jgi:hypothetical protein
MTEDCPYCDNVGWYARSNCSSLPWEAEQVQCEWCHTNPNSRYNKNQKMKEFCPNCDSPLNGMDYCHICLVEVDENTLDELPFHKLAQESCPHTSKHEQEGIIFCEDCWKALEEIK